MYLNLKNIILTLLREKITMTREIWYFLPFTLLKNDNLVLKKFIKSFHSDFKKYLIFVGRDYRGDSSYIYIDSDWCYLW